MVGAKDSHNDWLPLAMGSGYVAVNAAGVRAPPRSARWRTAVALTTSVLALGVLLLVARVHAPWAAAGRLDALGLSMATPSGLNSQMDKMIKEMPMNSSRSSFNRQMDAMMKKMPANVTPSSLNRQMDAMMKDMPADTPTWFRILHPAILREDRSLESKIVTVLNVSQTALVTEQKGKRVHIMSPRIGWASIQSSKGQVLMKKIDPTDINPSDLLKQANTVMQPEAGPDNSRPEAGPDNSSALTQTDGPLDSQAFFSQSNFLKQADALMKSTGDGAGGQLNFVKQAESILKSDSGTGQPVLPKMPIMPSAMLPPPGQPPMGMGGLPGMDGQAAVPGAPGKGEAAGGKKAVKPQMSHKSIDAAFRRIHHELGDLRRMVKPAGGNAKAGSSSGDSAVSPLLAKLQRSVHEQPSVNAAMKLLNDQGTGAANAQMPEMK